MAHNPSEKTQIDLLREKLNHLQKEREDIIMEKGLAAQENNDLRENFAYDYWLQKEFTITSRIINLISEISIMAKKQKKQATIRR